MLFHEEAVAPTRKSHLQCKKFNVKGEVNLTQILSEIYG